MKKLVTTVLCGLVTLNVLAQTVPGRPKLVVGIVVDQMRTDYIEYLKSYFGDRGFRRMMKDGVYMRDVDFKVNDLDAASATAMLYTGAYPSQTGVPASLIYDNESKKLTPALADSKTLGNFTNDSYSPEKLRLSTISDELSVDGAGLAQIYAFSPDPQQSMIMAGHAGTGAFWINNTNGNWATTTWYKPMPSQISSKNYSSSLASRIDTMQWKPMLPIDKMPGLPRQKTLAPFRHTFPKTDKNVYIRFSESPMANREVTDMAIECLKGLNMGNTGSTIDMLNLGYTVAPYKYVKDGDSRPEVTDAYLRLDKELGRLFDAIDRYVGAGNAMVWVSSTGYYDDAVIDEKKYRIPTGEFSIKRAKSLLNSYLSARHGNAGYVDTFKDGHLYFDHKAIEQRNLDINEVVADARSFLVKMSGVADALTLNDILSPSTPEEERMRLSIDPKTGGDIFVTFNPGWTVVDDLSYPEVVKATRETPVLTPAFIIAPGIVAETISHPVDATALAPTVSGILRIRSPNGSTTKPLLLNYTETHHK
ncbi:MAG: alkaline phosphatase family protein [Muribaculaceae bacterium]|nr:alkaline phosphatase family protein [Muribaculaceae bacterium]